MSNASNPRVEWRYHWDGSGRLRKAVFQDTDTNISLKVVQYYYDVLGRRVAKSINSNADGAPDAVTKYAYDGDDILYEFDASNALTARHTHGPGTDDPLYTQSAAGQYFYYHKDGMGSVREITDGEGKVVHRNEYDAFGNIVSVNGCPTAPEYPAAPGASCDATFVPARDFYATYAYTGRQWDAETALYHYRARYYDPHIGRFISEDPQWNPNLYAYVSNNPMKYTDPSGEVLQFFILTFRYIPIAITMAYYKIANTTSVIWTLSSMYFGIEASSRKNEDSAIKLLVAILYRSRTDKLRLLWGPLENPREVALGGRGGYCADWQMFMYRNLKALRIKYYDVVEISLLGGIHNYVVLKARGDYPSLMIDPWGFGEFVLPIPKLPKLKGKKQ